MEKLQIYKKKAFENTPLKTMTEVKPSIAGKVLR
jgi:hypothetical protein